MSRDKWFTCKVQCTNGKSTNVTAQSSRVPASTKRGAPLKWGGKPAYIRFCSLTQVWSIQSLSLRLGPALVVAAMTQKGVQGVVALLPAKPVHQYPS